MSPDLVRRAVIHPEGFGPPRDVHSERLPRGWLLVNALAEVPGEEQCVGPAGHEGRQHPELGNAHVLDINDHGILEWRILARPEHFGDGF